MAGKPPNWREAQTAGAEWRLRTQRRRNIYDRLNDLGPIAVLCEGSLLYGVEGSTPRVLKLVEDASRREVAMQSRVFNDMAERSRKRFLRLDAHAYKRLQSGFQSLGACVMLAAENLHDEVLLRSLYRTKLWCVNHGTWQVDQVLTYLKWLVKSCQCVLLKLDLTPGESFFPDYDFKQKKPKGTPFRGSLEFINELICNAPRKRALKLEEARALAQIANASRAFPYPSENQTSKSVLKVLDMVTEQAEPLSKEAILGYRGGLATIARTLGPYEPSRTHSSLTNSGSYERSQSEGGRAEEIVSHVRAFTDAELSAEFIDRITDCVDAFGQPVMPPLTAHLVKEALLKERNRPLTVGDVLYVDGHEAIQHLERSDTGYLVPKYLGNIVAMTATAMIQKFGSYNRRPDYAIGDLCVFWRGRHRGKIKFEPNVDAIPVNAALSIEASMKTRLVTSAPAALTQIGQLMRHSIAAYLSRDPTLRIGFDEPDKLWETLKSYAKLSKARKQLFVSMDLEEATYKMPHEVLDLNRDFLDMVFADDPVWRCFHKLFRIHKREIHLDTLREKGVELGLWPEDPVSRRGAFMGDSLSFMDLTLMVSNAVWQASYASHFKGRASTPLLYYDGYIARPLGQSVGDDNLALGVDDVYVNEFNSVLDQLKASRSKIDAACDDAGTFCEQWFVIPGDGDELRESYAKDSVFGDLFFLDTIKGSLLSGKSKVKADGADPFIGQARMLSKQIAWHPIERMRRIAPTVLWARNYMSARRLGNIQPHLPISLGGLDIAIGPMEPITDPSQATHYAAYLEAMLDLPIDEFLKWQMLLTGISRSNPKGVPWANDELKIALMVSKIETIPEAEVLAGIPEFISRRGRGDVMRYMSETLGVTSVRHLTDLMTRLEAFKAFWDGHTRDQPYLTISTRKIRPRFKSVWTKIRRSIVPKQIVTYKSWEALGKAFDRRTWGLLFRADSPALDEIYEGMTTLQVKWRRFDAISVP